MTIALNLAGQDWIDSASCGSQVDDWIWHDHGQRDEVEALTEARRICGGCVVRADCLEYALADPTLVGVWAGTTVEDRKRIVRNRARKSRAKEAS